MDSCISPCFNPFGWRSAQLQDCGLRGRVNHPSDFLPCFLAWVGWWGSSASIKTVYFAVHGNDGTIKLTEQRLALPARNRLEFRNSAHGNSAFFKMKRTAMDGNYNKKPGSRHFGLLGICGSGMRSLAEILLDRGDRVSATDRLLEDSRLLHLEQQRWNSRAISLASEQTGLPDLRELDRVVTSAALPADDERLIAAAGSGVSVQYLSEALAELFSEHQQICVAGTHGKSTTTGMLWWLLNAAGCRPGGFIGGELQEHSRSGFWGTGDMAVLESCEYRQSFLAFSPALTVLTGIDRDHFDCFPRADQEHNAFGKFASKLPHRGTLLVNGDCARALRLAGQQAISVVTYGSEPSHDWTLSPIRQAAQRAEFRVRHHGTDCGVFQIRHPGHHNMKNALAAIAAAAELGIRMSQMRESLAAFPGIRRRFEHRGQWRGMELIDDYAHHPGAIRATLETARSIYSGRRIIVAVEPHQISRTEQLFSEFARSLQLADECLILPVLPARENATAAVCCRVSGNLVREINLSGGRAFLLANLDQVTGRIDHAGRQGDVVITMGAGRTNQIHDEFNRRFQRDFAA
jgi:UDP-N-acetylmuramate--alanine ligase